MFDLKGNRRICLNSLLRLVVSMVH